MIGKSIKVGMGLATAVTAAAFVFPTAAYADYAPSTNDVVGVGSDTLQQLVSFAADGDFTGNPGYNSAANVNKFISIDATADANSRLAYGPQGLGPQCAPGTGATQGTGNGNTTHADAPCTLNPTVVLRAGTSPVRRPNGSGAGYNLLVADTASNGTGLGYVDFARASSNQAANAQLDRITVGTDPLAMLASTTTNAVALSASQLNSVYSCSTTNWSAFGGASGTIKPLLPQVGSGTRSSFLSAIGSPTLGSCVTNVEENDPEAIDGSGDPANAIEPMSGGRLNLFQGKLATGASNGVGGYFTDSSCALPPTETNSSTPTPACTTGATLSPNVKFVTGTPSTGTLFSISRPLYIYFRHADVNSTKVFQPGGKLNWVRTMFYNPCPAGATNCVTTGGVQYGPGGAPYFATPAAQSAISAAGITPTYAVSLGGG